MKTKVLLIATLSIGLISCGNAVKTQTNDNFKEQKSENTEIASINQDGYSISENSGITTVSKEIDGEVINIVSAPSKGFRWINESKFSLEDLNLTVLFSFNSSEKKYTVIGISNGGDYVVHLLKGTENTNNYLSEYNDNNFPIANDKLKNELFQIVGGETFKIENNKIYVSGNFDAASYKITKIYSLDNYLEEKQDFYTINKKTETTDKIILYKTVKLKEKLIELPSNTSVEVLEQKYMKEGEFAPVIFKVKTSDNKIGYCEPILGDMGNFKGMWRNM